MTIQSALYLHKSKFTNNKIKLKLTQNVKCGLGLGGLYKLLHNNIFCPQTLKSDKEKLTPEKSGGQTTENNHFKPSYVTVRQSHG